MTQATQTGELTKAARGAAVTLVGAVAGASLGFVLNFMIARMLGPAGAGIVLQTMAVYTIAMSVALFGLDTTAVWLLPRLREEPGRLRGAFVGMVVPAAAFACVVSGVWWLLVAVAPQLVRGHASLADAIGVASVFLPAGVVMGVAIAATRGLGGVLPFNLIDRLLVPGLRPILTYVAIALGGGTTAVVLAWSVPWAIGMLLALGVAVFQLRRASAGFTSPVWPDEEIRRRISRYAAPRVVASVLDQALIWLDVIIVGVVAGPVAAGVYGAASRFVSAGVVVSTSLRIVVAPRFSALLARRERRELQELYSVTAAWILLFGSPIYLTLAVFASTVLGWLGPGFVDGASSLVVLALGSVVVLAAGNIQSLLLMSGRSGLGAINKGIVVTCNVLGNLVLVPRVGIIGAAASWAACMLLDTVLAAYQVRRATGIHLALGMITRVGTAAVLCVCVPGIVVRLTLGDGWEALLTAVLLGGVALLSYVWWDRDLLHIDELLPGRSRRERADVLPGGDE